MSSLGVDLDFLRGRLAASASCSGVSPTSDRGVRLVPCLRFGLPPFASHTVTESCRISGAAAIPTTVSPSVSRYTSTASRQNFSVQFFFAIGLDLLASPA